MGPPSMIAIGNPVRASLRTTVALIAGSPSARFPPNPRTHLMPRRSSPPSASLPRRWAGMAWANEPSGRGWTAIFGGRSASATSATRVVRASASRSSIGGMAASTSAADRYVSGGNGVSGIDASLRGDDGLRCVGAPHRRRAEPRQPQAGTRRDRPLRRAGRYREGPAARRCLPADRRQRTAPRRHLGPQAHRARRDCPAAGRATHASPIHHPGSAGAWDVGGVRAGQGTRGRRGRSVRGAGCVARGRLDRGG